MTRVSKEVGGWASLTFSLVFACSCIVTHFSGIEGVTGDQIHMIDYEFTSSWPALVFSISRLDVRLSF
jgi:hypothetical protein